MQMTSNYTEKSKEELLNILVQQEKIILEKSNIVEKQLQEIAYLNEMIRLYQLRQFGKKSEKGSPDQLSLFDEAELPKKPDLIEAAEKERLIAMVFQVMMHSLINQRKFSCRAVCIMCVVNLLKSLK